jgi:hypothetical protein
LKKLNNQKKKREIIHLLIQEPFKMTHLNVKHFI